MVEITEIVRRVSEFRLNNYPVRVVFMRVALNTYEATVTSTETGEVVNRLDVSATAISQAKRQLMAWLAQEYPETAQANG